MTDLVDRYLRRYPLAATTFYFGVVIVFLFSTWAGLSDLYDRHLALVQATEMLVQLQRHKPRLPADPELQAAPPGSPVLEGPTITVAGAGLLQRVAAAIARVSGNALSSQVDLNGLQAKDGYISVVVDCELDESALQKLLYDLEAGMPFLFVDQPTAQTLAGQAAAAPRLRVTLAVSGQWQGER